MDLNSSHQKTRSPSNLSSTNVVLLVYDWEILVKKKKILNLDYENESTYSLRFKNCLTCEIFPKTNHSVIPVRKSLTMFNRNYNVLLKIQSLNSCNKVFDILLSSQNGWFYFTWQYIVRIDGDTIQETLSYILFV